MFRRIAPLFIALASIACGPEGIAIDEPESPTLDGILAPDDEPSDEGGDEAAGGWGGEDPADPEPLPGELVLPDMPEDEPAGLCCSCVSDVDPLASSCELTTATECLPVGAAERVWCDGWASLQECVDALCQ